MSEKNHFQYAVKYALIHKLLLAENTEKYVEKYLFTNNVCRRSPGGFTELVQLVIFVEIDIYGKLSSAGEQNHSQNRSEQKRKSHLLPFSMKMLHPVNKVTRSCPSLEFSAITNIQTKTSQPPVKLVQYIQAYHHPL